MATAADSETTPLVLTPPDPVPALAPEKAVGLVPVEDGVRTKLQAKVADFVDDLVAQDVNSPEFGKRVDAISAMGQKEIRAAADQSNRFLDRPVKAMDGETGIGADLTELRRTIEKLDPSVNGKLISGRGMLSKIFGGGINTYFDKYRSSQSHISAILKTLARGKDELLMDNAAIRKETEAKMERFDVRPPNPNLQAKNFSGGNQQKIVLAREIERNPDLLLVGQPTRGVDIGAIEFIHQRIVELRDQGKAILLVSVELEEILSLSDRIIVMFDGHIMGERDPAKTDEKELGMLMAGMETTGGDA